VLRGCAKAIVIVNNAERGQGVVVVQCRKLVGEIKGWLVANYVVRAFLMSSQVSEGIRG